MEMEMERTMVVMVGTVTQTGPMEEADMEAEAEAEAETEEVVVGVEVEVEVEGGVKTAHEKVVFRHAILPKTATRDGAKGRSPHRGLMPRVVPLPILVQGLEQRQRRQHHLGPRPPQQVATVAIELTDWGATTATTATWTRMRKGELTSVAPLVAATPQS